VVSRAGPADRGAALPAALVVVAVATAVSALLAALAQTEILLARSREAAAGALAAADGCLAAVAADLPAGWEFDALIAGADGIPGTPDDGARPAPPGCTATLAAAPSAAGPPRAFLRVQAVAGTGRRVVEAVVTRAGSPGVPALIWLTQPGSLQEPRGTLALVGTDAGRPAAAALSPLAGPDDPAGLDAWLVAHEGRVVVSPPGAASVTVPPPPVADLAARLSAAGAVPGGTLVPAGTPPLALTLVAGDLLVAGTARGRGLLFVEGLLDITGTFEFSGVVVVSTGIRIAAGGRLDVGGGVWLGSGATLAVDGEARVAASADALEAAEGLLPLPRRARLASQHDPP